MFEFQNLFNGIYCADTAFKLRHLLRNCDRLCWTADFKHMGCVQRSDVLYIWLSELGRRGQHIIFNGGVKVKLSYCLFERNIYIAVNASNLYVKTIDYFFNRNFNQEMSRQCKKCGYKYRTLGLSVCYHSQFCGAQHGTTHVFQFIHLWGLASWLIHGLLCSSITMM
jgi:hypothetical protein